MSNRIILKRWHTTVLAPDLRKKVWVDRPIDGRIVCTFNWAFDEQTLPMVDEFDALRDYQVEECHVCANGYSYIELTFNGDPIDATSNLVEKIPDILDKYL